MEMPAGQHRFEKFGTTGDLLIGLVVSHGVRIHGVLARVHPFSLSDELIVPGAHTVEVVGQ